MIPKLTTQSGLSILLFLLIITLIGGNYLLSFELFGFEFYAYRIVLLGGFIFLVSTKSICITKGKYSKWILFILAFWFIYGVLLLIKSPNLLLGIKELYYLGIGYLTYLLLLSIKVKLINFYSYLERYWLIGFITLSIFLLIEFITHRHLEGTHFDKLIGLGYYHYANVVPIFTFGNPNHLAIYFCLTITLSIYFILRGCNFFIHSLVIFLSISFLLFIDSRLSYLFLFGTFIFLFLLYIFKFIRNTTNIKFNWKTITILFFLGILNLSIFLLNHGNIYKGLTRESEYKELTIENNLVIAVDSLDYFSENYGTADHVFPIEEDLKNKLYSGDEVNVKIENITAEEFNSNKLFMDETSNKWLSYWFILCILILLVAFIFYSFKFNSNNLLGVAFACLFTFVGVFMIHHFNQPNKDFQYSVLTEADSSKEIKKIAITSIEAKTAIALKKGQTITVSFNQSKESELALSDSIKPLNTDKEPLSGDVIRRNLILNGLDYFKESNYMGIGPGAYMAYNQQKRNKYPVGTIDSPHNFVIEILTQYGIIVFALFFIAFGVIFVFIIKSFFKKVWSNEHTFLIILFVCLLLLGNANSRFLSLPINWFIISFIFIVSDELIGRNKKVKGD